MKKLKVGVIDLVSKGPTTTLWAQIMHANLASIMPQVVAAWCEERGHEVTYTCYTGREDLLKVMPRDVDIIFISSFTQASLLAYALSNYFRRKGVVTVLGGPHARSYPDDAALYFDYVIGFTDQALIDSLLEGFTSQKPIGKYLTAARQPSELTEVKRRWKFIQATLRKAPFLQIVPMVASVGCPYTCPFCVDSVVPYATLNLDTLRNDLQFLRTKFKKPFIGWHDPNFGVRFDQVLSVIADAAPMGSLRFIGESSLSILTEPHLRKMQKIGFRAVLPGVESWYELGNKSGTIHLSGEEKVKHVAAHVNMMFQYIPYIQTNFVLGLDSDSGEEPFELTKRFIDRCPGAFPGYSLLTSFGATAPLNLQYQQQGRVLPFPFHFLNNHLAMNVKPKNYEWIDFYDKVIDLTEYTFSKKAIYRRWKATSGFTPKWMNFMRALSSEGYGRIKFYREVRDNLVADKLFRAYFEGETSELPSFYFNIIKRDLGKWWEWLPAGAVHHDVNAYLKAAAKEWPVKAVAGRQSSYS